MIRISCPLIFPFGDDPATIPVPPNFMSQHPFNNGEMLIRDEILLPWPRTTAGVQRMLADYHRYVSYVDMLVGQILDALAASPHPATPSSFSAATPALRGQSWVNWQTEPRRALRPRAATTAGPGIPPTGRPRRRGISLTCFHPRRPRWHSRSRNERGADLTRVEDPANPAGQNSASGYKQVQRALRDDRWKLIRYPQINRTQLFDLQADPMRRKTLHPPPAPPARLKNSPLGSPRRCRTAATIAR